MASLHPACVGAASDSVPPQSVLPQLAWQHPRPAGEPAARCKPSCSIAPLRGWVPCRLVPVHVAPALGKACISAGGYLPERYLLAVAPPFLALALLNVRKAARQCPTLRLARVLGFLSMPLFGLRPPSVPRLYRRDSHRPPSQGPPRAAGTRPQFRSAAGTGRFSLGCPLATLSLAAALLSLLPTCARG